MTIPPQLRLQLRGLSQPDRQHLEPSVAEHLQLLVPLASRTAMAVPLPNVPEKPSTASHVEIAN